MSKEQETPMPPSIHVVEFENEPVERLFLDVLGDAYAELRQIVPALPLVMNVTFGSNYEYGDDGVTGSAVSGDSMKIGVQPDMDDRARQFNKIRPLVFHEGFHIAQGFGLQGQFSALQSAVYEGCATIFEREYAGSEPKWGNYGVEDEATLQRWYEEMRHITAEQYFEPTGETWRKWAFYDSETDESWRVYKVGTWLVERVLRENDLDILAFSAKTADDILTYL